ncbi:hypothetical protein OAJ40_01200 [Candidatus Pelagibacter sp.]|nr:hypothetical protein [Candidatus Pelagibacter sp.]
MFLIATHSQAEEDEWDIYTVNDMIVTSVPGKIVHGDKLRFILKKNNCKSLNVLFSFLTYKAPNEIHHLKGKTIPIKINEEAILGAAEIIVVRPTFNNMAHLVMLSAPQSYELDNFSKGIMRSYNLRKIFTIELMDADNFDVKKYFNISINEWNLDRYPEKINEAYNICIKSSKIDNVISESRLTYKYFKNLFNSNLHVQLVKVF